MKRKMKHKTCTSEFITDSRLTKRNQKRLKRRLICINQTASKKCEKVELSQRESEAKAVTVKILKKNNIESIKSKKRHNLNYFLEAFSFIPQTRLSECLTSINILEWKSHSFNEIKQYKDFFKQFIYPYYIPEPLLLTTLLDKQYCFDTNGSKQHILLDNNLIQLSRKWICDIVNGKSFYKINKMYFTKQEAHYFLNSKTKYIDTWSVVYMFFEAKCKARSIPDYLCKIISRVFTVKF
jgi:hypothetical protein